MSDRRAFLKTSSLAIAGLPVAAGNKFIKNHTTDFKKIDETLKQEVLKAEFFREPVIIESLDLLRYNDNFICRVRSKNGAVGYSVGNNDQLISLYPIFTKRLKPFFIGKDARDWEILLEEVYVYQSNYKLQSLALWVPLATIEFAVLDMLGRIIQKSMGELIGIIHNSKIAVYQANGDRGIAPEKTIENIKRQLEESKAKAIKFKLGGRMSSPDEPAGRTEKLISLVRKTFGDKMTVYADSNGSFNVDEAIRIGKILEEYNIDFYEEPVPFDWYEETKKVKVALKIPVAGGEQEASLHNFRWLIGNKALDIVQPDIFYFGGMVRSVKVARMADLFGIPCTPHISGSGLGYLYMMHFVSAIPNPGPYHEFKGFNRDIPLECKTSSLESDEGVVTVPSGPGSGIEIDPEFIAKHKEI